jgi:uncharacterized protein YaaN involved in tellurite resistance
VSKVDDLKAQAAALERRNALLARTAELLRQNAELQREATARAKRAREGTMPSAGKVYARHNRKA